MRTDKLNRLRHALRSRHEDERGSLFIAVTVIMVVVLLSSVLFLRVLGNTEVVVARQSVYGGVSSADAGLSDALFQLDQGNTGTGTMICLNGTNQSDSKCTVKVSSTATPQLSGISYVARLGTSSVLGGQVWTVQALGNASTGMKGAVQETLSRVSQYPFALFGKKSLLFTGNTQGSDFGTYTPGAPGTGSFTACPTTATNPPCLYIGTDGSISCQGNSPQSVVGVYYNTGSGGGSDSCGTSQSGGNTSYPVPDPTTPPGGPYTCPGDGTLGSASSSGIGTLAPGTYVCTTPVTISGSLQDTSTTDPIKLYILLANPPYNQNTTFLTIAGNSNVNTTSTLMADMQKGGGPSATDTLPDSQLFQVYSNSTGLLDTTNGTSNNFAFGGIIYAPEASMTANGCQNYFFGAAVISTDKCHGGPNLAFYYDSSLSQDWGPWQVSGYTQINPKSVSIP